MKKGYPPYGYVAEGYWCDIGNISQYYEAHLDIMRGKVKLELPLPELSPGFAQPGMQLLRKEHKLPDRFLSTAVHASARTPGWGTIPLSGPIP